MASEAVKTADIEKALRPRRRNPLLDLVIRMFREKPLAALGLVIVMTLLVLAIFARVGPIGIAPDGINEIHPENSLEAPGWPHIFGTDIIGRDYFSRVVHGARVSIIVGLGTTALALMLGLLVGVSSAYIGGKFDLFLQRIVDGWMAFPFIILALVMVGVFQDIGHSTFWSMIKVILALTFAFGFWMSRIIRGAVLGIKENQYIEAARIIGCSDLRIIRLYIIPNIMAPVIILVTLTVGWVIFTEAALSFLGFGVSPPVPSWGRMLFIGKGIFQYPGAWWLAFFPGLFIALAIFGINILGDGLRDLLDPRLRGAGVKSGWPTR